MIHVALLNVPVGCYITANFFSPHSQVKISHVQNALEVISPNDLSIDLGTANTLNLRA